MDLTNYKIQVPNDSRQPTIICRICEDEVRSTIPGQPSIARLLEVCTKHEWTVHRAPEVFEVVAAEAEAYLKSLEPNP